MCYTDKATQARHRQERQRHKQNHQQPNDAATKQPTNTTQTYTPVISHTTLYTCAGCRVAECHSGEHLHAGGVRSHRCGGQHGSPQHGLQPHEPVGRSSSPTGATAQRRSAGVGAIRRVVGDCPRGVASGRMDPCISPLDLAPADVSFPMCCPTTACLCLARRQCKAVHAVLVPCSNLDSGVLGSDMSRLSGMSSANALLRSPIARLHENESNPIPYLSHRHDMTCMR